MISRLTKNLPRTTALALPPLVAAAALAAAAPVAAGSPSGRRAVAVPHAHKAVKVRHANNQSCANADTPATGAAPQGMRAAVVCLINQQRGQRHLPALRPQSSLDRAAQLWTNVMVSTGRFTHGVNFAARITAAGFVWSAAGENIATGFQTPRDVVKAWMASLDHCQNILDPTYENVGTGLSTQPLAPYGPATWTQDFGLWMGHPAPSHNYGPQRGCPYRS